MRLLPFAISLLLLAASAHAITTPKLLAAEEAPEALTPGARIRAEIEFAAQVLGLTPQPLVLGPCPAFETAVREHFAYFRLPAPAEVPTLDDPALEHAIACTLDAMRGAGEVRDVVYAGVDWQALVPLLMSDDPALHDAPEVDLRPVLGAGLALADRVDLLLVAMEAARDLAVPADGPAQPPEIDLEPVLAVDRLGDTLYELDYALIVDTVGNDFYDDNAGGGMIAIGGGPLIEPTGNDSTWQHPIAPMGYGAPHVVVGGQFEDSELILSAALALDTDGDDVYGKYREPGRHGACTDEWVVRRVSIQGAGIAGPAMLIDTTGDNWLRGGVLAQGLGHVGGLGVLYLGPGDDRLDAIRSSQGSGVFAGVGIILNEAGNDTYTARTPVGGTFNGDLGICDPTSRYLQGSGFGRITGVAAGVLGILRDEGGNDVYHSELKSIGFGSVHGQGYLKELGGDDSYTAVYRAVGYGEGHPSTGGAGYGVLYEAGGDDVYNVSHAPALGMGAGRIHDEEPPPPFLPPTLWANQIIAGYVDPLLMAGVGVLLDRSGTDSYTLPSRGDDREELGGGVFGVFKDGEY